MSLKMELVFTVLILACLHSFVLPDSQGDALYALKNSLNATGNQLKDWNPNQVNPCTWSNVNCDPNNNVISVILSDMGLSGTLSSKVGTLKYLQTLTLQGNGITGVIPKEYGNLLSLQTLNLERNNLTGVIPSSLGKLKQLQFLILSRNNLTGTIPESLSSLQLLTNIHLDSNNLSGQIPEQLFQVPKYNFIGNRLNCGVNLPHPCATDIGDSGASHKPSVGVIVSIVAGLIVTLCVGGLLYFICNCRRKGYRREIVVDLAVDQRTSAQVKRFALRELLLATDNFNEENVLAQGGFGKLYKGVLSDNTKVAVKRLTDHKSPGGEAAFQREVKMISVADHRNILRLIGFCATSTERFLVYPFMQNLSVGYRLREIKPGEAVLDWPTRKRVALGTARGLEYLHEHCNPKIIHRDVKAANVLLDENFEAVVGDFGLAKLVDFRKTNVTTQVCGTWGHITPEYMSTGKASARTDVFGYGILLLELLTGQRAIDYSRLDEGGALLLDHVKKLEREKRLDAIVDHNLKNDYDIQQVEMMIGVALLCAQQSPQDRPAMSDVVRMLEGEGLAERWEEWQHVEINRGQEDEQLQRRVNWLEHSTSYLDAMELSGGR